MEPAFHSSQQDCTSSWELSRLTWRHSGGSGSSLCRDALDLSLGVVPVFNLCQRQGTRLNGVLFNLCEAQVRDKLRYCCWVWRPSGGKDAILMMPT